MNTAELKNSLQHVQVPNNMCLGTGLEPFDLLVYATIRRFINARTKEAYPSLETMRELLGCNKNKLCASIDKLKKAGYLTSYFKGRQTVYVFSKPYKNFEPFSIAFLDSSKLTTNEKAYLISMQQYMFKDIENLGKVSIQNTDLEKLINLPSWKIRKNDRSLQEKGLLELIKTNAKDFSTGLPIIEKLFNMGKLGQQIIWAIRNNTKRIEENTKRINSLIKDLAIFKKLSKNKNQQLEDLKKQLSKTSLEVLLKI